MTFHYYTLSGSYYNGAANTCTNNAPQTPITIVLDDLLEPYSFVATATGAYCCNAGCTQTKMSFSTQVRDKNGAFLPSNQAGCFTNNSCRRYEGVTGLSIVKGASVEEQDVPPNTKYSCVNGQCQLVANGAFDSLAECQAVCKPIDGSPCNCPPPSVCFSEAEMKQLSKSLLATQEKFRFDYFAKIKGLIDGAINGFR